MINFLLLHGKAPKEIRAILIEILAYFLPGRATDLSVPLYHSILFIYPTCSHHAPLLPGELNTRNKIDTTDLHIVMSKTVSIYIPSQLNPLAVKIIVISVNSNWVDTRWQQYSTHLHTNSTQNKAINNFGWKASCDSIPVWSN